MVTSPNKPTDRFAIDVRTGAVEPLRADARPGLDALDPIEASIETVKAFDGLSLPVITYLPKEAKAAGKRLPVIVEFHGGPSGSSAIGWDVFARFFTALGYAYLEPNVRGSTGYGRAFEMADNREKRADWLRDLESVNAWIKAQPWADPGRVIVMGGSYGGYTVLMALTRQPSLWRAGVDYVGIANLSTFLASTDQRSGPCSSMSSETSTGTRRSSKSSARSADVDQISAPLYVYAGQNDPRVPREESDQVVLALRARGIPVEYQVAAERGALARPPGEPRRVHDARGALSRGQREVGPVAPPTAAGLWQRREVASRLRRGARRKRKALSLLQETALCMCPHAARRRRDSKGVPPRRVVAGREARPRWRGRVDERHHGRAHVPRAGAGTRRRADGDALRRRARVVVRLRRARPTPARTSPPRPSPRAQAAERGEPLAAAPAIEAGAARLPPRRKGPPARVVRVLIHDDGREERLRESVASERRAGPRARRADADPRGHARRPHPRVPAARGRPAGGGVRDVFAALSRTGAEVTLDGAPVKRLGRARPAARSRRGRARGRLPPAHRARPADPRGRRPRGSCGAATSCARSARRRRRASCSSGSRSSGRSPAAKPPTS